MRGGCRNVKIKLNRQDRAERHKAGVSVEDLPASGTRRPIIIAKSPILKRSINIAGHKTSVSLEEEYWTSLRQIAGLWDMSLFQLIGEIDCRRQQDNLSSALRLFVLDYFRSRAEAHTIGADAMAGIVIPGAGLER